MTDGFGLFYRHWPAIREGERVVVCIHGWGRNSEYFGTVGEEFGRRGIEMYAPDLRGFGNSVERGLLRGDTASFKRHLEDIGEFVNYVRGKHPNKKIFMLGHSIGGNYILWYSANHPDSLNGIILAAPGIKSGMSIPKGLMMKGIVTRIFAPKTLLNSDGVWPEALRNSEDVRFFKQNPLDAPAVTARYAMSASRLIESKCLDYASRVSTPTLIIQGASDTLALPTGAKKLLDALASKDKELKTFPEADHYFYHVFFPQSTFQDDREKREHVTAAVSDWLAGR